MVAHGPDGLTPREDDVLAGIARRLTNGEIAGELGISVRTVETHVASLRRKLGADSRAQLRAAVPRQRRPVVLVELPPPALERVIAAVAAGSTQSVRVAALLVQEAADADLARPS